MRANAVSHMRGKAYRKNSAFARDYHAEGKDAPDRARSAFGQTRERKDSAGRVSRARGCLFNPAWPGVTGLCFDATHHARPLFFIGGVK